jgi:hypothetical protein
VGKIAVTTPSSAVADHNLFFFRFARAPKRKIHFPSRSSR